MTDAAVNASQGEVEDAYRRQLYSVVDGDLDALNELLADDYTARHITGYEQPKAEWLAEMCEGQFDYHRIEVESLDVLADGDAATVVSHALVTVTIGGGRGRWPLKSTVRFERRVGTWIATAAGSTTY
jgi:ketosteroid isomerase-like protein